MRYAKVICLVAVLILNVCLLASSQTPPKLESFFKQNIGLNPGEIASIRKGQAVTKVLSPRTPAEVFLFGAIYINAAPERYFEFNRDFERLRKLPNYLALGVLGQNPQPADLAGFIFDKDDVQALKKCKPADCLIQLPASSMEEMQRSINWSSPRVNEDLNQLLQRNALERLAAYRRRSWLEWTPV